MPCEVGLSGKVTGGTRDEVMTMPIIILVITIVRREKRFFLPWLAKDVWVCCCASMQHVPLCHCALACLHGIIA